MSDLILSDTQGDAIKAINEWYNHLDWMSRAQLSDKYPDTQLHPKATSKKRKRGFDRDFDGDDDYYYNDDGDIHKSDDMVVGPERQVFRLFGYAGTGKTTITKHAIGDLGLNMDRIYPDVRFGAYTGKAAYVMRKHDTPARTIHSLIYSVSSASEQEIKDAKKRLDELIIEAGPLTGMERIIANAQIGALRLEIKKMHLPQFGINLESEAINCKLIVLDEVSMVNEEMAQHLLGFGKPILVLGDPGQLPPIRSEGYFTEAKPDVMLTEIHRQATDSAIIRLATAAREGRPINYGKHSETVWKMRRTDVEPQHLLRSDQVICGRNATRLELNNAMRVASGFDRLDPLSDITSREGHLFTE